MSFVNYFMVRSRLSFSIIVLVIAGVKVSPEK